MSERIINRGKKLKLTIDGITCSGVYGETILQIARRYDIYIPTMCYLSKVSPIGSCRMCVVDVSGVDGFVLSCQEKAVDKAVIATNSDNLHKHRQNIMKLYDVNHPLQCGVCDKSGECDLQDKTLEFEVSSQQFMAKDQYRKKKKWGVLSYDPSLCILCEKCVSTCNEIIGTKALYIKTGGYKSTIDISMSKCEQCGDCISVCPVGAMASSDFKYRSNAWELSKTPSSCGHCSAGCALSYESKPVRNETGKQVQKIVRVTNDSEFGTLCGAGRFGFDFATKNCDKDVAVFDKALKALKTADTIKFNSYITNEEAYILQQLKAKLGVKLVNEDAVCYKRFLENYTSISNNSLYTADTKDISNSGLIVLIGSRISRDNPAVKYAINQANKKHRASFIYMHPIDDIALSDKYTSFVKYEAGAEEAVIAMLGYYLLRDNPELKPYIDTLDIGNLSGESSVGEEEIEQIYQLSKRQKTQVLIIGEDIYRHKNATNIAKIVGLIDRYSSFAVCLVPPQTNSLGVSLICDMDDNVSGKTFGYNVKADFVAGSIAKADISMPSLCQQEGTFVTIDKKVVNLNVAVEFDGYCLNDIANAVLDEAQELTVDYTAKLPTHKGFVDICFDDMSNGYDKHGVDTRGYTLQTITGKKRLNIASIDDIDDIGSFDGTVIYRCEPLHQFNYHTHSSPILKGDKHLRGSVSFATAAKIKDGDKVSILYDGFETTRRFKIDKTIRGTIALYPTFASGLDGDDIDSGYRFKKVKVVKDKQ